MLLDNTSIRDLILEKIGLSLNQSITIPELWKHLCERGYRKDMVKFMDIACTKLPKVDVLNNELDQYIAGPYVKKEESYLTKKFKIAQVHLANVDVPVLLEDKGQYILELHAHHYNEVTESWSHKATEMCSIRLK